MSEARVIFVMVVFIVVGIMFLAAGFYFSSKGYLQALADSREDENEKRNAVISGKLCGTIALALGGLTIVSGVCIKLVPKMFHYMALIYVLALIACFAALIFTFNRKK